MLHPGFVQNSTPHSHAVRIWLFLSPVVQPYSITDTATAWKIFFLSGRSDFYIIDNLSIAVHDFPKRISTSVSVDGILLPRNVMWSTYFRGLLAY